MANKTAKIMAILALLGILISVAWTWILFFMGNSNSNNQNISKDELQKLIDSQEIQISNSWTIEIQK